jgi:Mn2+/Fe2+ NRAMP family transporter
MLFLEINENFGEGLYSKLDRSVFFVLIIVFVFVVVGILFRSDKVFDCVLSVVGFVICFSVVVFLFLNPSSFLSIGGYFYDLFMGLLTDFGGVNRGFKL